MNIFSNVFLCGLLLFGTEMLSSAQSVVSSMQPPSESNIQSWLRSEDPQLIAWGAHYAWTTKHPALVSDLLSLAASWQALPNPDSDQPKPHLTPDQLDRRDAMAAALDALIQMHASVPVDSLRNLAPDFPNYVAIFLSRLPPEESQSLSIDLYRTEIKNEYSLNYVSAALLAHDPPAGFAADLFSGIRIRATIFVVAPGAGPFGTGGGGHDCGMASPPEPRKQWPTFGIYEFSKGKSAGSFRVVSGIEPIYAKRTETTHYKGETCAFHVYLGPEERRSLLAQMLNVSPEAIGWSTETEENFEFKSDAQFSSDLLHLIAAQQEKFRATASALLSKGLITSAEQEESLPQLDLHINDMRGAGYSSLAAPSPLPPHVSWSDSPWR